MMRFLSLAISAFLCFAAHAQTADKKFSMRVEPEGLYVSNVNVEGLQKMYADFDYIDFIYMPDWKYPPVFLEQMPVDFASISDQNLRNKLFIQILAPLTMRLKEELLVERMDVLQTTRELAINGSLTNLQKAFIEEKAKKYDVFTKIKDESRYGVLLEELMLRVDEVPPSLLIAISAAESNWGSARETMEANSLFKTKVWYTNEGLKPLDDEDNSYRIKIYPSLYESLKDQTLKMNTDINYQSFRGQRALLRSRNKNIRGRTMAHKMVVGSPLDNYAGLVSYILTFYDLINLDEAHLMSIPQLLGKK